MKTIYLWSDKVGHYKAYKYTKLSELKKKFAKRGIYVKRKVRMGDLVTISNCVRIEESAKIGKGVLLFENSVIGYKAEIKVGARIGDSAKIGSYSVIDCGIVGDNCYVGKSAYIENDVNTSLNYRTDIVRIAWWGTDEVEIYGDLIKIKNVNLYLEKESFSDARVEVVKRFLELVSKSI